MKLGRPKSVNRWLQLFLLAASASTIYLLPYLRYAYYDTMLIAFNVNNTELGTMMSMFGIFMILFYFPGGWISDRFSNRKVMSCGLILTGAAGLLYATFPAYPIALAISIFWSASTAMLFWTAMISVARTLGSEKEQGRIFGLLEGGRGLIGTLIGLAILPLFNSMGEGVEALRMVILIYSGAVIFFGVMVFIVIQDAPKSEKVVAVKKEKKENTMLLAAKNPVVWLVTIIFFCTMSLYITIGYLTPYSTEIMGCSVTVAAAIGIIRTWGLQTLGGPIGGVIADKISTSRTLILSFIVITIGFVAMLFIPGNPAFIAVYLIALVGYGFCIFANRGIYFATLSEAKVPLALTGSATAIITGIGGCPDAFLYTVIGSWMDNYPGMPAYQLVFIYSAACGVVGFIAALALARLIKQAQAAVN